MHAPPSIVPTGSPPELLLLLLLLLPGMLPLLLPELLPELLPLPSGCAPLLVPPSLKPPSDDEELLQPVS
jgi:hypothetical protein